MEYRNIVCYMHTDHEYVKPGIWLAKCLNTKPRICHLRFIIRNYLHPNNQVGAFVFSACTDTVVKTTKTSFVENHVSMALSINVA